MKKDVYKYLLETRKPMDLADIYSGMRISVADYLLGNYSYIEDDLRKLVNQGLVVSYSEQVENRRTEFFYALDPHDLVKKRNEKTN